MPPSDRLTRTRAARPLATLALATRLLPRPAPRRSLSSLQAGLCLLLMGAAGPAAAQLQLGGLQGVVTNEETGKPLAGVTVVVSGPSLQGDQTEFTDASGRYQITQLPPGDNYLVRFYFNDVTLERPGVRLRQGATLTVSVKMPTQKGQREVYVIKERAPNIDAASAQTGVEINQELLQNTAVRGRTYESVIQLAPGVADVAPRGVAGGDVGVSIAGSTGNENAIVIDGLNTTDPNFGLLSVQLNQYFIKEINIITGGYQAEFGRATGGIVSVGPLVPQRVPRQDGDAQLCRLPARQLERGLPAGPGHQRRRALGGAGDLRRRRLAADLHR